MAKILVTGGAGYIGSHVVKLLGEQGHELTVIDNLSTGKEESILYGKLLNFDLNNFEKLEEVISKSNFDTCFHFAGSILPNESVLNPIKYYQNNTVNTLKLIELCLQYKVKNFLFSSTAAVYKQPDDGICTEETTIAPQTPYGKTKYMTEQMLEDISYNNSEFNYVVFRYFNVAGANNDGKLGMRTENATHLIKVVSEVAAGKRDSITVFGDDYDTPDGTCYRDFIHIDDLAQAHVDGMTYLVKGGESTTLNCGYGKGYSVKEVISTMEKVTGKPVKFTIGDRREGDLHYIISKADKIRKVLNWEPKFNDIDLICKSSYDWEIKL